MPKDMFSDTIEDMLQAELSENLGYRKHDQSEKNTDVCRCMVHLIRNSTKYIPTKERKEFCADWGIIRGKPDILWGDGWDK